MNKHKDGDMPEFSGAEREMMDGYFDGQDDDRLEYPDNSNRSAAYRHGWLNGRDDRTHSPRAFAQELREQAAAILTPSTVKTEGE